MKSFTANGILQLVKQQVFKLMIVCFILIGMTGVEKSWGQTNPALFDMSSGSSYSFTTWASSSTAGTYPGNMIIWQHATTDPTLATAFTGNYTIAYSFTSASRCTGQGANGISFCNTGTKNTGGGNLGAAVVGLNTTNRNTIVVAWTGRKFSSETYNSSSQDKSTSIRLQYRVGTGGTWTDVSTTEYSALATATSYAANGTSKNLSQTLPAACEGQASIYLRWVYYVASGSNGSRPEIGIDDISISSSSAAAATAPVITSPTSANIVNTTATLGGNVTSNGGTTVTATGVVWSANATNNNPSIGGTGVTTVTPGTAISGVFTVNATGLPANTLIAYRAYATNSVGTTYTTATTFTTLLAANKLAFGTAPPATGSVGSAITTFTVLAQRQDGTTDAEYTGSITIALVSGTNNLSGTLSTNASAGVATFNAVQFSATGTYTIDATASGLTTSATSSNIVISIANATANPWIGTGSNSAWLTTGNWNTGSVPAATQVAQFGSITSSGNTVGINMNTHGGESVGGIEFTSLRTSPMTIGNSSTTANGLLTINGVIINSIPNIIIRNNSSADLTLQNTSTGSGTQTMGIALGNGTNNIIDIDAAGGVAISSIISGAAPLAKAGTGAGKLVLSAANTYTGLTTITGGTLQLNHTGGTTIPITNSITVGGGTLQVSKNQTIANFTMSSGTLTVDAATTLTITGTYNVTGGTINNLGTINFNGAAISFPGAGATVNNGTANTLAALTVTTGSVTLSADIIVTGTLSLTTGTSLAINGNTLTANGAISGTGKLTGSPLSNLVLNGTTGTINFTLTPDTLLNLTVGNNASVTLGSLLGIAAGSNTVPGKLTLGTGTVLNTGNKLTLLSDNNSTAMVASIPEAGNGAALATINGTVTVNRYLHSDVNVPTAPANGIGNISVNNGLRAWRLLTAPVTQTGSVTIKGAWQNNGIAYNANDASTKGIGTLITGGAGGNGLDAVSGVSLYSWTTGSLQAFTAVSNTNVPISNGNYGGTNGGNTGYMLFVRGDRDLATLNNPNNGGVNITNTMLNPNGNLITGRQVYNVTPSLGYGAGQARFTLIGNPYAAPVDMATLGRSNLRATFYVWNPNLNTVGGFVTEDFSAGVNISVPNKGANQYLQSGQAFLVYGDISTTLPTTLTFDEINKVSNNNNYVFRPASVTESFTSNLFLLDGTTATLADGNLVQYSNSFNASVDNLDALKLTNTNENLALIRDGVKISIERRPVITNVDTLYFNLTQTTARKYQFQFTATELNHPGLIGLLKDSYTGDSTVLDLNNTTTVNFTIDTSKASKAADRFMVVFKSIAIPLPVTFTNIKAAQQSNNNIAVTWNVQNEINIKTYEVEKSTDDKIFTAIGSVIANGQGLYNLEDIKAVSGTNFYRIRSIGTNGVIEYSMVVKVVIGAGSPAITVYPNSVQDGYVAVQFMNMPPAGYVAKLITMQGQILTTKTINHSGGSSTQTIPLSKTLAKGIYQLEINNTSTNTVTTCTVQCK